MSDYLVFTTRAVPEELRDTVTEDMYIKKVQLPKPEISAEIIQHPDFFADLIRFSMPVKNAPLGTAEIALDYYVDKALVELVIEQTVPY